MKDLIVLVADLDIEKVFQGLLPRVHQVCNTRPFTFEIKRHPERDPGCLKEGANFLRTFVRQYRHALVVFDREGCGREPMPREKIEAQVEAALNQRGWEADAAAAIAIDPEIENWIWQDSPHVVKALNWQQPTPLYPWLQKNNLLSPGAPKPARPKEALQTILRMTGKPFSAAIHHQIATHASWRQCKDPAFLKLIATLTRWFST